MPQSTCTADNCEADGYRRNLCSRHYRQVLRGLDPHDGTWPVDCTLCGKSYVPTAAGRRIACHECKADGRYAAHQKDKYRAWAVAHEAKLSQSRPCLAGQRDVECDRPGLHQGYCPTHWKQIKAGRPLSSIEPRRKSGSSAARDDQGRKQCARCLAWKLEPEFGSHGHSIDRLQSRCRACVSDAQCQRNWGMTRADVEEMALTQGGCAICRCTADSEAVAKRGWHVDHDHSCCPGESSCGQCIRGILCAPCNSLLGFARDDLKTLDAAAQYLLRNASL